jgi:hypothetical protein
MKLFLNVKDPLKAVSECVDNINKLDFKYLLFSFAFRGPGFSHGL